MVDKYIDVLDDILKKSGGSRPDLQNIIGLSRARVSKIYNYSGYLGDESLAKLAIYYKLDYYSILKLMITKLYEQTDEFLLKLVIESFYNFLPAYKDHLSGLVIEDATQHTTESEDPKEIFRHALSKLNDPEFEKVVLSIMNYNTQEEK